MGVIDESGLLEENEIFVQLKRDNFRKGDTSKIKSGSGLSSINQAMKKIQDIDALAQLIEGDVLVTRNPCHHPGDIRKLKCVYKEELKHLYNVVVFSSKGERP